MARSRRRYVALNKRSERRAVSTPRNNAFYPTSALLPARLTNEKSDTPAPPSHKSFPASKWRVPWHKACIWIWESEVGVEIPELWRGLSICERGGEGLVP